MSSNTEGGESTISELQYYSNREHLKSEISSFALKNVDENKLIDHIELTLPNNENIIIENRNITVVDMPGIEDAICLRKMLCYIEQNRYKILPMFVIDLDSGTTNLIQFKHMKDLFRKMKNFRIPFVLTKFSNLANSVAAKMDNDGEDVGDMDLCLAHL